MVSPADSPSGKLLAPPDPPDDGKAGATTVGVGCSATFTLRDSAGTESGVGCGWALADDEDEMSVSIIATAAAAR